MKLWDIIDAYNTIIKIENRVHSTPCGVIVDNVDVQDIRNACSTLIEFFSELNICLQKEGEENVM